VEWLGEIPAHWLSNRLKDIAPSSDERIYDKSGDRPYVGLEHIEAGIGKLAAEVVEEPTESTAAPFAPAMSYSENFDPT
jgi:hypothetical protein